MLGMPTEFELMASAELEDGTHVPLTEVRGRRTRLQSGFQPRLKPLLLTTMGRTGSTWVTSLLACLPQIVAYRPFQFEPRVASYWMEVLRCLAEPASYMQALAPELYGADWWMGTKRSSPIYQGDVDPDILEVLARDNLEKLAAFCQERIDRFYGQVANRQGQSGAIHFLEKYAPNAVMLRFLWELYPDAREIFLIRDLRDILSSILAFNKIYAQAYFYRERAQNDLEIVREMRNEANTLLKIWRTRSQSAYLLRYEDLIRRPEESLRGVLDYLELDGDPTGIRHTLKQAARTMPEAQQQHRTSQDPLASIGRWRRDLNPALQEACQEAFPELLGAFGYDDD
jgi:hypothetical protein